MMRLDDPTSLSLLFHLNSEPWLNDEAYKSGAALQELTIPPNVLAEVALPEVAESALTTLVRQRRSCRAFARRPMAASLLAAVLAAAYGIVESSPLGGGTLMLRRAVPSAGGLYPLELYAVARDVDGVEDGLHHYDAIGHRLELLTRGDLFDRLEPSLYPFPFVRDANVVLLLSAVFRRTQKKYGPRGYRYILLEAGHVGQNVCLRATELGLSTLCMGGFVDSPLMRLLGLRDGREGLVYSVAVGYGA
jgi:SagB-type dehydrogenase family enzyme